jgi:hypothetical protein
VCPVTDDLMAVRVGRTCPSAVDLFLAPSASLRHRNHSQFLAPGDGGTATRGLETCENNRGRYVREVNVKVYVAGVIVTVTCLLNVGSKSRDLRHARGLCALV